MTVGLPSQRAESVGVRPQILRFLAITPPTASVQALLPRCLLGSNRAQPIMCVHLPLIAWVQHTVIHKPSLPKMTDSHVILLL